ncbi:MFS transporter [Clostridium saccharobutylicum]|uniref:Inner membrane transport protein YdiM n=1 Tax=Clostridium saccharobutylicum DSM 13864 TaxID=1345695 RepID=U5MMG3_CLOSA|nr:MFS transporter [Clostridium saccharobutylicum]AGX41718.1 inner membrane transport protein YdiM [Clostridium saccharobutylicum DSM 13864]AQR88998.1 inner membrane transport protein YdiM [Clostridium saccharobutylicum]AQR98899.1 inner membrane transport protein YdiM [Clostridium saccharobutylicum]AQS08618.1 inner membrane transport protein YdiM [Clostridium saccharobutylicum]AQS12887.1 inner membrane transport protein YdiM [Clostridium saccharobutylicum]
MRNNKYFPTALGLYINYFIHGMGVIILSQNMNYLIEQLHTNKAGVAYVISALGIGRFIVLYISGALSDKFGRKPFVILGIITYILFFAGILVSPNVTVAFIFGILAGMANSFLDSGTIPALMECFPEAGSSANVFNKAFISAGQFLLPMGVSIIVSKNLWYGYSFVFCIIVLVINAIYLFTRPFPAINADKKEEVAATEEVSDKKSKFWIEGIALIVIGFTSTATFMVINTWIPSYGREVAGMVQAESLKLVSYYSIGSILAVIVTSILVKSLIKPVRVVFIYPLISLIMLIILYVSPTPTICLISAFVIGFAAAGGVLQLALTAMADIFPSSKGKITGMVYSASSIASFTVPAVTGAISSNVSNVILFNIIVTGLGVVLAIVVNFRYNVLTKAN